MDKAIAVEIQGVSHIYGQNNGAPIRALADINLTIYNGDFVSIVGPSGCGKSTLLSIIAGLLQPGEGYVLIEEASVEEALRRRRLAMVFQDPVLLPWRTTQENIQLPLELSASLPIDARQIQAQIKSVMLQGFESRFPKELSGGMRSRVAIARALVLSPSVLLMDEPFGSLDELTAQNLNLELLRIWEEQHPTIILVTHSISQAVFMSDRVIVLSPRPGRIVEDVNIDLPRPRTENTLSSERFLELSAIVRRALSVKYNP